MQYLYPLFLENETAFDFNKLIIAAIGIFFCYSAKLLLKSFSSQIADDVACKISSCTLYLIYNKVLFHRTSNTDETLSPIRIIADDFRSISLSLSFLICNVVQTFTSLIASSAALIYVAGWAAVCGVSFAWFIGIPIIFFFGALVAKWRKKARTFSDKRVSLTNELLFAIRIVKCNAYEMPIMRRIDGIRKQQMECVINSAFYASCMNFVSFVIAPIMFLIIILVLLSLDHSLAINDIVLYLIILSVMGQSLHRIAFATMVAIVLIISRKRINTYLSHSKFSFGKSDHVSTKPDFMDNIAVRMRSASISWKDEKDVALTDISVSIERGKLVAVIGSVGCGKTALIQAMMGEMNVISGYVSITNNAIAYTAQHPFIINASVRDNIIMDMKFDEELYEKALWSSVLLHDLKYQFPSFDQTIIGSEGVNISGGQKARISYARALYHSFMCDNTELYLFDAIFANCDVYVARQMFVRGVLHDLQNRTRVVILTSHLQFLPFFDEIWLMDDGKIVLHATPSNFHDLIDGNSSIKALLPQSLLSSLENGSFQSRVNTNWKTDINSEEENKNETLLENKYSENNPISNPDKIFVKCEIPSTVGNLAHLMQCFLTSFDYEQHFMRCTKSIDIKWFNNRSQFIALLTFLLLFGSFQIIYPFSDIMIVSWITSLEITAFPPLYVLFILYQYFIQKHSTKGIFFMFGM